MPYLSHLEKVFLGEERPFWSIYLSIYLSIHPSIHPSIHLSIYLSIAINKLTLYAFFYKCRSIHYQRKDILKNDFNHILILYQKNSFINVTLHVKKFLYKCLFNLAWLWSRLLLVINKEDKYFSLHMTSLMKILSLFLAF